MPYTKTQLRAVLENIGGGRPPLEGVTDTPPVDGGDPTELVADLARQLLRPARRRRIWTAVGTADFGDGARVARTYAAAALSERRALEMIRAEMGGDLDGDLRDVRQCRNPLWLSDEPGAPGHAPAQGTDPETGEAL